MKILVQGVPGIVSMELSSAKRFICTKGCFTVFETNNCGVEKIGDGNWYCCVCPVCMTKCHCNKAYYDNLNK